MLAVLFALKSFSTLTHGKHVKVMVDNTVTDSTINQMGTSHSPKLKKINEGYMGMVHSTAYMAYFGSYSRV